MSNLRFTRVFLAPRNTAGVIVKTNPNPAISFFFEPRNQTVNLEISGLEDFFEDHCSDCEYRSRYNYELEEYEGECHGGVSSFINKTCLKFKYEDMVHNTSVDINTEPYIFRVKLSSQFNVLVHDCYLNLYNQTQLQKGKVMVMPYRLGNVHVSGNICWGDILDNYSSRRNLRLLHNLYWESPFNKDLIPEDSESLSDWVSNYSVEVEKYHSEWENYTYDIKGESFAASEGSVEGILFSTHNRNLGLVSKHYRYRRQDNGEINPIVVGFIKRGEYKTKENNKTTKHGYYMKCGEEYFSLDIHAEQINLRPVYPINTKVK